MKDLHSEIKEKETERMNQIHLARKNGVKIIGYHCVYAPLELIYSAGAIPVRLSRGGEEKPALTAQKYVRSYYCDFAASCIGYRMEGKDNLFKEVDYMMMAHTCDKMKKVMELWNRYLGVPAFTISLPRKYNVQRSLELVQADMEQAKEELEGWTGNEITKDKLETAINSYNQMREFLHQIYKLRKNGEIYLRIQECLDIVRIAHFLDVNDSVNWLKGLITQLKANSRREKRRDQPRLMITGTALACGDQKLQHILNEVDVDVVIEDTCTGSRWFWDLVEKEGDPLRALSRHLLYKIPSCGRMIPMDRWFEHLKNLAKDYKVDGVIFWVLHYCDGYGYLKNRLESEFREMKIPLLYLTTTYSDADEKKLLTMVQAFRETISG